MIRRFQADNLGLFENVLGMVVRVICSFNLFNFVFLLNPWFSDIQSEEAPNFHEMLAESGAMEVFTEVVSTHQAEEINVCL